MKSTRTQKTACTALIAFSALAISALAGSLNSYAATDNSHCAFTPMLSCSDAAGEQQWQRPDLREPSAIQYGADSLYLEQNNRVLALQRDSGKQRWVANSGSEARYFTPVLANKVVYLARSDGQLEKRRTDNGRIIWAQQPGAGWIYPPLLINNQLISGGRDRMIWRISPDTGAVLERTELSQELVIPLVNSDGLLIASTFDGKLTAYTAPSAAGQKLKAAWTRPTGAPVFDLQLQGNTLIASDMGGVIRSIAADTGKIHWQQALHQNALYWNTQNQGKLYSLNQSGELITLDLQSGRLLSRRQFTGKFDRAPIVQDNILRLFDTHGTAQNISINALSAAQANQFLTSNQVRIQ